MRKIYFILPLLLIFATACCNCNKTKSAKIDKSTLQVKLSKSACYGRCPEYTIELKDGIFNLDAGRNTPLSGTFISEAEESEVGFIAALLKENNVMDDLSAEEYDQAITDLPYCTMTITVGGKQKTIKYRVNVPKKIADIDNFLSGLLSEQGRWESTK